MTLELLGLTKSYPGAGAAGVRDLTLRVDRGGVTALLGPSGAGKSTVLRLIAGLMAPDAGDIRLDGHSILHQPPERRKVVMVFQNALLFPHLTLAENLGFGLRMRGLPQAEIASRVAQMLERVQLSGLGDRRPHELSGGQQQRGALARALVLNPRLLLLDEPLSNLDATLRDGMRDLILDLQRDTGVTMLVVTHDQSEAVVLADRVALLMNGRLAQEDTPSVIYRRPASIAVARFFGGTNFLTGRAEGCVFHGPLGPLALPDGTMDGPGTLTIRPEAIGLGDPTAALQGSVVSTTFLGTQSRVVIRLGDQRLEALTTPEAAAHLTPGMALGITLPTQALWLIPDGPG
jgi:ABC-type Fe3+/spermidine/putrescine transport system ATPase subunit